MQHNCEQVETLISGYIDDELTQQQSQQVFIHIESCAKCQALYQELKQIQSGLAAMEQATMKDSEIQQLMSDKWATTSGALGWLLLIGSVSLIVGFIVVQFFANDQLSLAMKLFISAPIAGVLFLLLSVLRQRLIARKNDRYKGVDL
ncbi:MAG: zf-HC2 domain-containing protein [Gammaproteobacteria bacterium]|nr:zf-HC2 domain-containing protein [Gammaproteobacteria bacterium]NVK87428.1 zf-HC2 domain-containing protein [Gammaproteobacteria bacterium]